RTKLRPFLFRDRRLLRPALLVWHPPAKDSRPKSIGRGHARDRNRSILGRMPCFSGSRALLVRLELGSGGRRIPPRDRIEPELFLRLPVVCSVSEYAGPLRGSANRAEKRERTRSLFADPQHECSGSAIFLAPVRRRRPATRRVAGTRTSLLSCSLPARPRLRPN